MLLALAIGATPVQAQEQEQVGALRTGMQSPTAASLGEFGEVPVSLYTGTPNVSVSLHTAKGRTIELPITLRYRASGVKVEDIPSWVGMGWALEAGGAITRTVRGLPDDAEYGYLNTGIHITDDVWEDAIDKNVTPELFDYISDVKTEMVDPQPDQFFFNFAGQSGQFVIDANGEARVVSKRRLKVEYHVKSSLRKPDFGMPGGTEQGIDRWIITTENGTKYIFGRYEGRGGMEMSIHDVYSRNGGMWEEVDCTRDCYWPSTWYLVEIVSPSGDESIELKYHDPVIVTHDRKPFVQKYWASGGTGCPTDGKTKTRNTVEVRRLKAIRTGREEILFESSARTGFMAPEEYKLDALHVETPTGLRKRSLAFAFDNLDVFSDRLLLREVSEIGSDGTVGATHSFDYNQEVGLPNPLSKDVDHWGYFNDAGNSDDTPEVITVNPWDGEYHRWQGNDRSPDTTATKAGALKRITYPTGGHTELFYEPHDYGYVGRGTKAEAITAKESNTQSVSAGHPPLDNQDPYVEEKEIDVVSVDGEPIIASVGGTLSDDPDDPSCSVDCARVSVIAPDGTPIWGESAGDESKMINENIPLDQTGKYVLRVETIVSSAWAHVRGSWNNRVPAKTRVAGGLRIRKIKQVDDIGDTSVKTYGYYEPQDAARSSGVLRSMPRYWYNGGGQCVYTSVSSGPVAGLGFTQGSPIGYGTVTVRYGQNAEGGYEVHHFRAPKDIGPDHEVGASQGETYWPFGMLTSHDFKMGQQTGAEFYDASDQNPGAEQPYFDSTTLVKETSANRFFADESPTDASVHFIRALTVKNDVSSYTYFDPFLVISAWSHVTSETETIYDGSEAVTTKKNYGYEMDGSAPAFMQMRSVAEWGDNVPVRTTRYEYAHESHRPGMGPGGTHQLSQRYTTTVEDASGDPVAKQWTTWRSDFRPEAEWIWIGSGSEDTSAPSDPSRANSETIRQTRYAAYGPFGRPTETVNAYRQSIFRTYGGPWSENPFLTEAWTTLDGQLLEVIYDYNDRGLLSQITGESGGTRSFFYDEFGRLEHVSQDGSLVSEHQYFYQDCDGEAGDPGCVLTTAFGGDSPNQVTTEYVDGLGRPIQTHVRAGGVESVITAQSYDALGREHEAYRPYRKGVGHAFDDAVPSGQSLTETSYYADPLGRPKTIDAPGPGHVEKSYGVEELTIDGETDAYRYEKTEDEEGQEVKTYVDGFGREVATVADPGGINATTTFAYDAADNLTKVTWPEEDEMTYTYDRAGRLLERDSPDAGRTEMKYDAAGNVRFSQDAKQRASGEVAFTTYDALGRPLRSGVAKANFSGLDPNQEESFESDEDTWREVYAYDEAPDLSDYPWNARTVSNLYADHSEGRTAAVARRVKRDALVLDGDDKVGAEETHSASTRIEAGPFTVLDGGNVTMTAGEKVVLKPGFEAREGSAFRATVDPSLDDGDSEWRLTFYSYDAEGRLREQRVFAPGLREMFTEYEYDRQGRLLQRDLLIGDDGSGFSPGFFQWYQYNDRGLLAEVYASASYGSKPSTPEVAYTYAPDGQVVQATYRSGEMQSYGYNDRGWLTGLSGTSAFGASYDYYDNGNVEASTFDPAGKTSYTYAYIYDGLSRLKSADYEGASAYDVTGISYDRNGNLETLTRRGAGGSGVDNLTYDYDTAVSPNRLDELIDQAGVQASWDAGSGSFDYDRVGNLTKAPAPYGLVAASYDERNLPTAMEVTSGDTTISLYYRYSQGGQRTYQKVEGSAAAHYVLDGDAPLGVFESGSLSHWNVLAPSGEIIGRHTSGGSRRYYLKDHLGSIRAVVGGSKTVTRDYYPFGLPMPGRHEMEGTREDFTGHEKDDATGLHYAGARYYMSAFGRWNVVDPILGEKGPNELLEQDERLFTTTAYGYTFNNPVLLVDPDGRMPCPPCDFEGTMRAAFGWMEVGIEKVQATLASAPNPPDSAPRGSVTMSVERVELEDVPATPTTKWTNPTGGDIRNDADGFGHFGARRDGGTREHTGVDLLAEEGQTIVAPFSGKAGASGSGFPMVTSEDGIYRFIGGYGKSTVSGKVNQGDSIGVMTNMTKNYPNATEMKNHLHGRVDSNGVRIDMAPYIFPQ